MDSSQAEEPTFADGTVEHWETFTGGKRDVGFGATYTVLRDRVEFKELGAPPSHPPLDSRRDLDLAGPAVR